MIKLDEQQRIYRNKLILSLFNENPRITQVELVERLYQNGYGKTSRQNISLIMLNLGLKKKHIEHHCPSCNIVKPQEGLCRSCYKDKYKYTIVCDYCGNRKVFYGSDASSRRQYDKKRYLMGKESKRFCSKKCTGHFVGKQNKKQGG